MNFGTYLTQLREAAGLKKSHLAKKIGISLPHVVNLEKGRTPPPPKDRLEQIAGILALSAEQKETLFNLAFQERNLKELSAFKKSLVRDSASDVEYGPEIAKVPVLGRCDKMR